MGEKIAFNKTTASFTCILLTMFDLIDEKWMRVMKYEAECIENMEWVESYETYIWFKKTALTLMLPIVFDLIDETMNKSGEVWRWVHQRYSMSPIVKQLHSI